MRFLRPPELKIDAGADVDANEYAGVDDGEVPVVGMVHLIVVAQATH